MKISARDIRVFVAGVFAYQAIQGLMWMPYEFQHLRYLWAGAALVAGIVGLLIAIGLLFDKPQAIRWTMRLLWVFVVLDVFEVCRGVLAKLGVASIASPTTLYENTTYLITFASLLGLMIWTRSKRFTLSHDA